MITTPNHCSGTDTIMTVPGTLHKSESDVVSAAEILLLHHLAQVISVVLATLVVLHYGVPLAQRLEFVSSLFYPVWR